MSFGNVTDVHEGEGEVENAAERSVDDIDEHGCGFIEGLDKGWTEDDDGVDNDKVDLRGPRWAVPWTT